jgi:hypothetical protein
LEILPEILHSFKNKVIKGKSENNFSYLNHTLPRYDTGGSSDLKRVVAISSADFKYSLIACNSEVYNIIETKW